MRNTIVSILLIVLGNSLIAGSGWVKKKKQHYLKLNQFWVQTAGGYFDQEGLLDPMRMASLYTTSLYGEIGTGEGISIEFYVPIYSRNVLAISDDMGNMASKESIGGIGDVNFGLKQSILAKDHLAISMSYMVSIPLGVTQGGSDGTLFTGDGDLNGLVKCDIGVPFGLGKIGGYINGNIGYNLRSQNFSNELWYGSELGISFLENNVWIIGRLVGIEATQSGSSSSGIPFASNVSFLNYSVETAYYLNSDYGISAGYVGNVNGSDVLITPAYNVGFFYDLK